MGLGDDHVGHGLKLEGSEDRDSGASVGNDCEEGRGAVCENSAVHVV